jgi:hypothetical protein
MTTRKHTPSPWHYEGAFLRNADDGACVLKVNGGSDADLALIAAAPELLDSLEAILEESGIKDFSDAEPAGTVKRIAYLARAAIAKAKGEAA